MLSHPVSLTVIIFSLPRLLGIAGGAAFLALAGCSTYETGTPKTSANYSEAHPAASDPQTDDADPEYRWFY